MSSYVLSLFLAVVACVIGGTLGGMILARPQAMLELAGLSDDETPKPPLFAEGRALGGVLIASVGLPAAYLADVLTYVFSFFAIRTIRAALPGMMEEGGRACAACSTASATPAAARS